MDTVALEGQLLFCHSTNIPYLVLDRPYQSMMGLTQYLFVVATPWKEDLVFFLLTVPRTSFTGTVS